MATFSGVGVSSSLFVAPNHGPSVVITGTFVATVLLERAVGDAWVPVATITSVTNVGLPNLPGVYRLRCTDYTSGTVTYALSSTPMYQVEIRAPDGSLSLGVDANGAGTLNDVTINQEVAAALAGTILNLAAENGLTAHAGGTQAAALALSAACAIHRVATVTTAADSVKLPPSTAGALHLVTNGAASNAMQVFGSGTDTINGVATATGVSQSAGITALYVCPVAGTWYATAIADAAGLTGFTGSSNTGLGAGAGGNVASGENVSVGKNAAAGVLGSDNVAVGFGALGSSTNVVSRNVALGAAALGNGNVTGSNNVAAGYEALASVVGGASNAACGYQAGNEITSGTGNALLGYQAGKGQGNVSNKHMVGLGNGQGIIFDIDEMGNLLNISVRYADGTMKTSAGIALI